MSDRSPGEWAELFEGKTADQILWTEPPDGLSEDESHRFRAARLKASTAALGAQRAANKRAEGGTQAAGSKAPAAAISPAAEPGAIDRRHFGPYADRHLVERTEQPPVSDAAPAAPAFEPIPLVIAMGRCEEQLERQLASGAGLIEYLVQYIARYDTEVSSCLQFADRICSVMKSSAGVAKAVGRLRGLQPEETRHRVFVEYGPQGGGVLRT